MDRIIPKPITLLSPAFATPFPLQPSMLPHMRSSSKPLLCTLAAILFSLAACQSTYRPQGTGGTVGAYRFGRASVRISDPVRIPAIIAAANAALRARGYTIESMQSTADQGCIIARQPDSHSFDKLVVSANLVPGAVEINITRQPFGDEERSRAVMDAILQRLGL